MARVAIVVAVVVADVVAVAAVAVDVCCQVHNNSNSKNTSQMTQFTIVKNARRVAVAVVVAASFVIVQNVNDGSERRHNNF